MPISHAAMKQLRKDKVRNARNASIKSDLRTAAKRLLEAIKSNQVEAARAQLQAVIKKYDMAASKGIIHRNTAARSKSRYTKELNKLRAA